MQYLGSNSTYNGLIQQATAAGLPPTGFNWTNTVLAAIPWGFFYLVGFNFGTYLAGETKDTKSTFSRSIFLSLIVAMIFGIALAYLSYVDFGQGFLNAASYIEATNPSALPVLPTVPFLVALTNPGAAIFIGVGLWIGWLWVTTSFTVFCSRVLFAASFDRLLPDKFGKVNERFHSPYLAVLCVAVLSFLYDTLYWYGGYASTWLNTSLVAPISYLLPVIALLVFPFAKPELFKKTVGLLYKPVGLTVACIVAIICFAIYIVAELVPIMSGVFLGASLIYAAVSVLAMFLIGVLIYVTSAFRLQKLGLSMKMIYADIPPE
jgi:amino acid transporter